MNPTGKACHPIHCDIVSCTCHNVVQNPLHDGRKQQLRAIFLRHAAVQAGHEVVPRG